MINVQISNKYKPYCVQFHMFSLTIICCFVFQPATNKANGMFLIYVHINITLTRSLTHPHTHTQPKPIYRRVHGGRIFWIKYDFPLNCRGSLFGDMGLFSNNTIIVPFDSSTRARSRAWRATEHRWALPRIVDNNRNKWWTRVLPEKKTQPMLSSIYNTTCICDYLIQYVL